MFLIAAAAMFVLKRSKFRKFEQAAGGSGIFSSIALLLFFHGHVAIDVGIINGLHLGHQEVIHAAREHAKMHHGTPVVATFDPHPAQVLRPGSASSIQYCLRHQQRSLA